VALAAPAPAMSRMPRVARQGKMRCFLHFPIGLGPHMSYIPGADEIGQTTPSSITEQETWRRKQ